MTYHETLTTICTLAETLNKATADDWPGFAGPRPSWAKQDWQRKDDPQGLLGSCLGCCEDGGGLYDLLRHLAGDAFADYYLETSEIDLSLANRNE